MLEECDLAMLANTEWKSFQDVEDVEDDDEASAETTEEAARRRQGSLIF